MNTTATLPSTTLPAAARAPRRVLRRVGAVLAGLVAIFAITTATDIVMHVTGVFPPVGAPPMADALFLLALAYRLVYGVAGGYFTARLAPDRPIHHALVLGGVGLVVSVAGTVALRDAGPVWYPLALAASALPCAWLGGRFHQRRSTPVAGPR
jgi:hypothetical protein